MIKPRFILPILTFALLVGCSSPSSKAPTGSKDAPVELVVSAAASLSDALGEEKKQFEKEHSGITLTFNLASSGKLVQQIEQGAPVDLFLSAGESEMDLLQQKGLLQNDSRINFAKNQLVFIVPKNSSLSWSSFDQIKPNQLQHLALGEPQSVPAGRYAKQVLEKVGVWDALKEKLVFASDVRQVLTFVDSGNADAGIVYSSDAKLAQSSKVIAKADPSLHSPIVYPGAVVSTSVHQKEAKEFLDFLHSQEGKEILSRYGFQ